MTPANVTTSINIISADFLQPVVNLKTIRGKVIKNDLVGNPGETAVTSQNICGATDANVNTTAWNDNSKILNYGASHSDYKNSSTSREYTENNPLPDRRNKSATKKLCFSSNSLKIMCWNLRGINDKLRDQHNQQLIFKNDIILITETHSSKQQSEHFNIIPGFKYYDFPRKYIHPHAPKPSGGIGIFVKQCLIEGVKIYSTDECIVWVNLKGSSFGWDRDKLICCAYFSPIDSSYLHSTIVNTDYFNILQEQIAEHNDQGDIFICGDLNARTGQLQDSERNIMGRDGDLEDILYNMDANATETELGRKSSQDVTVNSYGRCLIDLCKVTGFRIMNGRLHNDKNIGEFTYESYLGKSTIDLLICKASSISAIKDFSILPMQPTESDHKPVYFSIHLPRITTFESLVNEGVPIESYKWNYNKLENYLNNYESEKCQTFLDTLMLCLADEKTGGDQICKLLYKYIESAIDGCFQKKSSKKLTKFPNNPWFDNECKMQKRTVNNYKNRNNVYSETHEYKYKSLMKEYNRVKQQKSRSYKQDIRNKLKSFDSNNPSEYWKLWKSLNRSRQNTSNLI